jgi:VanZ family protein
LSSFVKIRLVLLVYVLLVMLVSLLPTSSGISVWHLDKVGHFLAYCGMAILALLSFHVRSTRLVALLATVGLGALLEWGQSFVPGRHMSLADGIVNALGVGTGALLFRFRGTILLDWTRSRRGKDIQQSEG